MKKKLRRKVMRTLYKNTTKQQRKKLRKAYKKELIDFESSLSCPLGVMFENCPSNEARKALGKYNSVSEENKQRLLIADTDIEIFWINNPKKGLKDVKYFLSL